MAPKPRCAVVTPFEGLYSETFIRDQIARLPFHVVPVYGLGRDVRHGGVFIASKLARLLGSGCLLLGTASAERWAAARLERSLASFWKRHGVGVILAQFAVAGADVLPSAMLAGVPVVVHCHGYDVYESTTLKRMRAPYQRLFANAAAFISVSSDMDDQLHRLGAPAGRIHRIPVGVDTELFQPTDPGLNPPIILAVG